jgi:hypothetical protein
MTRRLAHFVTPEIEHDLNELLNATTDSKRYGAAMRSLGKDLGRVVAGRVNKVEHILVVSTVEDADFLTRGLLEEISEGRDPSTISIACFWNDRKTLGTRRIEIAPILRRYVEPFRAPVDAIIVLKSIISGACVVRTNLMELLEAASPRRVIVVAPVILQGAEKRLEVEFSADVTKRFEYVYFAEDSEKTDDGIVLPGIGGEVYELLGFGKGEKNRYRPELVRQRERLHH